MASAVPSDIPIPVIPSAVFGFARESKYKSRNLLLPGDPHNSRFLVAKAIRDVKSIEVLQLQKTPLQLCHKFVFVLTVQLSQYEPFKVTLFRGVLRNPRI
jgi:hypothetical protein